MNASDVCDNDPKQFKLIKIPIVVDMIDIRKCVMQSQATIADWFNRNEGYKFIGPVICTKEEKDE